MDGTQEIDGSWGVSAPEMGETGEMSIVEMGKRVKLKIKEAQNQSIKVKF